MTVGRVADSAAVQAGVPAVRAAEAASDVDPAEIAVPVATVPLPVRHRELPVPVPPPAVHPLRVSTGTPLRHPVVETGALAATAARIAVPTVARGVGTTLIVARSP